MDVTEFVVLQHIVRDFYASYVFNLRGSIDRRARPAKQDSLTSVLLWGCQVDISETAFCRFMYDPTIGTQWALNTGKFNYR